MDAIPVGAETLQAYTAGFTLPTFLDDRKTVDAAVPNRAVVGEAVNKNPVALRASSAPASGQASAGLRAILAAPVARLELTEPARQFIARTGYDPVYGARPLKRFL